MNRSRKTSRKGENIRENSGDRKKKAEKMNIYAQLLSRTATRVASARSEYTIYIRPQKRVHGRVITDDCEDKKKNKRRNDRQFQRDPGLRSVYHEIQFC